MCGNVVDVFKVPSENVKEYFEFEMDITEDITEAQPGGLCTEGEKETVVRNDVKVDSRTDACWRHCRDGEHEGFR